MAAAFLPQTERSQHPAACLSRVLRGRRGWPCEWSARTLPGSARGAGPGARGDAARGSRTRCGPCGRRSLPAIGRPNGAARRRRADPRSASRAPARVPDRRSWLKSSAGRQLSMTSSQGTGRRWRSESIATLRATLRIHAVNGTWRGSYLWITEISFMNTVWVDVLGLVGIAQDAQHVAVDVVLVAEVEEADGIVVPRLGPHHCRVRSRDPGRSSPRPGRRESHATPPSRCRENVDGSLQPYVPHLSYSFDHSSGGTIRWAAPPGGSGFRKFAWKGVCALKPRPSRYAGTCRRAWRLGHLPARCPQRSARRSAVSGCQWPPSGLETVSNTCPCIGSVALVAAKSCVRTPQSLAQLLGRARPTYGLPGI